MDTLDKNWQLINSLFCDYQRRSTIHQKCVSKPILVWAQIPHPVIKPLKPRFERLLKTQIRSEATNSRPII
jgi:hypothetical protein